VRSVAIALERKRQALDPNSAAEQRGIRLSAFGGITFGENASLSCSTNKFFFTSPPAEEKAQALAGRVLKI